MKILSKTLNVCFKVVNTTGISYMYHHPPEGGVKQIKMKTLKLEVGKTYRNRRGEEVRIVRKDNTDRYPYQGSDDEWYTKSGIFCLDVEEPMDDLIEEVKEVPETRHTFAIPDGVKELTVEQVGNRIIVEMVPEKEPKPGDVLVNGLGSVYIFKAIDCDGDYNHFAWLWGGEMSYSGTAAPGRPATPEEAKPLWGSLKRAGKRWNPEAMELEEIPEFDRILEWVEKHLKDGYYSHEDIAETIEAYLNYKEGKK